MSMLDAIQTEHRIRKFVFDVPMLAAMFVEGARWDRLFCSEGIPAGSTFLYSVVNHSTRCFEMFFSNPSWPELTRREPVMAYLVTIQEVQELFAGGRRVLSPSSAAESPASCAVP